jgi:hypothetical protein
LLPGHPADCPKKSGSAHLDRQFYFEIKKSRRRGGKNGREKNGGETQTRMTSERNGEILSDTNLFKAAERTQN